MSRAFRGATILTILVGMALVDTLTVRGGTTVWTIDSSMSSISLGIPQQPATIEIAPGPPPITITLDFRAANQSDGSFPWSVGNTSALAGTIQTITNYNTMIDFLGGTHAIDGLPSGDFDPLPGGAEGTAPADFGGLIQARDPEALPEDPWSDTLLAAIRDAAYDVESDVVPLSGGTFTASSLTLGVLSAFIDYRGVGALGGLVTPDRAAVPPSSAPNTAASGSIAVAGQTATLTIPISVPLAISASGVDLTATLTGTIVATNTLPIAGDANMDGFVDIFDVNVVSANWAGAPPEGDVNYDGVIDIFDVNVISANWMPGGGGGTAVPEPSTIALFFGGAATAAAAAARRRSTICGQAT